MSPHASTICLSVTETQMKSDHKSACLRRVSPYTLVALVPSVWYQELNCHIIYALAVLACLVPSDGLLYATATPFVSALLAGRVDIHVSVYEVCDTRYTQVFADRDGLFGNALSGRTRFNIKTSQACRPCPNGQSTLAILAFGSEVAGTAAAAVRSEDGSILSEVDRRSC